MAPLVAGHLSSFIQALAYFIRHHGYRHHKTAIVNQAMTGKPDLSTAATGTLLAF